MRDVSNKERTMKIFEKLEKERRKTGMGKYYIKGKKYDTEKSILLCDYASSADLWMTDSEKLYRTANGAYFKVSVHKGVTNVVVLDEKKAFAFMDAHPSGIDTEAYDRLFGTPTEG